MKIVDHVQEGSKEQKSAMPKEVVTIPMELKPMTKEIMNEIDEQDQGKANLTTNSKEMAGRIPVEDHTSEEVKDKGD